MPTELFTIGITPADIADVDRFREIITKMGKEAGLNARNIDTLRSSIQGTLAALQEARRAGETSFEELSKDVQESAIAMAAFNQETRNTLTQLDKVAKSRAFREGLTDSKALASQVDLVNSEIEKQVRLKTQLGQLTGLGAGSDRAGLAALKDETFELERQILLKKRLQGLFLGPAQGPGQVGLGITQKAFSDIDAYSKKLSELGRVGGSTSAIKELRSELSILDRQISSGGRVDTEFLEFLKSEINLVEKSAKGRSALASGANQALINSEERLRKVRESLSQGSLQAQINAEERLRKSRESLSQGNLQAQINAEERVRKVRQDLATGANQALIRSEERLRSSREALSQGALQAQINTEERVRSVRDALSKGANQALINSEERLRKSREALGQGAIQAQINAEERVRKTREALASGANQALINSEERLRKVRESLAQGALQAQINSEERIRKARQALASGANQALIKSEERLRKARESLAQGKVQAQINAETAAFDKQQAVISKLGSSLQRLKTTNLPRGEVIKFRARISQLNKELARTGKVSRASLTQLRADMRAAERATKKTTKATVEWGKASKFAIGGVARSLGAMTYSYSQLAPLLAGIAVGSAIKQVYELGAAFESTTKFIDSLNDSVSGLDLAELREGILNLEGLRTGPLEVAAGLKEFAKAGVDTQESLKQIAELSKFATLAEIELSEAVKLVIGQSQAFGITFEKAANVIAAAAFSSATSIQELGTAMSYTTELATISGVTFEEVATAMSIMANAGIRGCYDKETDVLTMDGWKKWEDVTQDDLFATYNQDTGEIEYQKADRLIRYRHTGKMYKVSNKGINLCVTPDHRMYVKLTGGFEIYTAEELQSLSVGYKEYKDEVFEDVSEESSGVWVDYDDEVFCAEVPNGLLIVRRNGRAIVSGNSKAGTALRTSILKLQTPTDGLRRKMESLGVSFDAFTKGGQIKDLRSVFQELKTATDNLPERQRIAILKDLFGLRSLKGGANILRAIGAEWDEQTKKIVEAQEGVTLLSRKYEDLEDTVSAKVDKIRVALQKALIEAFDTDDVSQILDPILEAVKSEEFKQGIKDSIDALNSIAIGLSKVIPLVVKLVNLFDRLFDIISKIPGIQFLDKFREGVIDLAEKATEKLVELADLLPESAEELNEVVKKIPDTLKGVEEATKKTSQTMKNEAKGVEEAFSDIKVSLITPDFSVPDIQDIKVNLDIQDLDIPDPEGLDILIPVKFEQDSLEFFNSENFVAEMNRVERIKEALDFGDVARANSLLTDETAVSLGKVSESLEDIGSLKNVEFTEFLRESEIEARKLAEAFDKYLTRAIDDVNFQRAIPGLTKFEQELSKIEETVRKIAKESETEGFGALSIEQLTRVKQELTDRVIQDNLFEIREATAELSFSTFLDDLKNTGNEADVVKAKMLEMLSSTQEKLDDLGIELESQEGIEYFQALVKNSKIFEDSLTDLQAKLNSLNFESQDLEFNFRSDIRDLSGQAIPDSFVAALDLQVDQRQLEEFKRRVREAGTAGLTDITRQTALFQGIDFSIDLNDPKKLAELVKEAGLEGIRSKETQLELVQEEFKIQQQISILAAQKTQDKYKEDLRTITELRKQAAAAGAEADKGGANRVQFRERELELLNRARELAKGIDTSANISSAEAAVERAKAQMIKFQDALNSSRETSKREYIAAKAEFERAKAGGADVGKLTQQQKILKQLNQDVLDLKNKDKRTVEDQISAIEKQKQEFEKYVEEIKKGFEATGEYAEGYNGIVEDGEKAIKDWGKESRAQIKQVTDAYKKLAAAASKVKTPKVADIDGARAMGGPVQAGKTYLTGELGPELFVPKTSGNIIPNNQLGRQSNDVIDINLLINGSDPVTVQGNRTTAEQIERAFKENTRFRS